MGVLKKIFDLAGDMVRWRRDLHARPELAFHENATSDFLRNKLQDFGVDEIHTMAGTGLVAVIRGQASSGPSIMIRADMDALPLTEKTGAAHASQNPGVHHACGHDGHMAMLLAAVKVLAETRNFSGTVYAVFQPAEESESGAKRMIDEGFFQKFPASEVYGLHNFPGLPLGLMATGVGDMLASSMEFSVSFSGVGGHSARPADSADVVAAASEAVLLIKQRAQERISLQKDPAVVTIPVIKSNSDADNILADHAEIKGSLRCYDPALKKQIAADIRDIATTLAAKYGASANIQISDGYPVLTNAKEPTLKALAAARDIVSAFKVVPIVPKTLGVEDFAHFLKERPGNFIALGTGPADGSKAPDLHSPKYDFNDAALPIGASYWVRLVERVLPLSARHKPAPPGHSP
ncbi:MAG: amidohydrolase [Bdellovibrionales bacterium]